MESSEVGGCRGGGIARFIPRIPGHRLGGNGSSPDVGRPLDGFSDGLRVTLISKRKECFPNILEILLPISSADFVPTKQSLPSPVNLDIGVNPQGYRI